MSSRFPKPFEKNISAALAVACFFPALAVSAESATEKPNLVLVIADQWRGDALGCLKIEPVKTPRLDSLIREGVNFTQAVSSYPVSSPARGMLMTGLYPHRSGVPENCNSRTAPFDCELRPESQCWSDVLSARGYNLAYIGKWHLDAPRKPFVNTANNHGAIAWNEWTPPDRRHGFAYWHAYGTYDRHLRPMYWDTNDTRENFKYYDKWGPEHEAEKAIAYLSAQKKSKKPFAMVVSMNPPHTGYNLVPDRYKKIYANLDVEKLAASRPDVPPAGTQGGKYFRNSIRDYYACMTGVDEQVGRIVDALKANGQWENTLFVFTSDHGDCMGINEQIGKRVCRDTSMRIPLIMTFPNKIRPRQDDRSLVAFADLAPTMLSLLGLRKAIPAEMQTFDFSKVALEEKGAKAPAFQPFFRSVAGNPAVGRRGIRDARYTFAVSAGLPLDENERLGKEGEITLYDRKTDPYQLKNIAAENPALVSKYMKTLKKFLKEIGDPALGQLNQAVPR